MSHRGSEYELAPAAERDLLEIARYTLETWGDDQAALYATALEEHLGALARGTAWTTSPVEHRPDLLCSRCQHHFVFAVRSEGHDLLVLAVLHESMDLMARLRERLERQRES